MFYHAGTNAYNQAFSNHEKMITSTVYTCTCRQTQRHMSTDATVMIRQKSAKFRKRAPVDRYSETCRQMSQTEMPEFCVLVKLTLSVDRWMSPVDRCHRPEQPEVCLLQICCNLSTDTQHLSTDAEDLQIRKPSFISKIVFSSPTTLHMKTQLYKHPFEENLVQKQPQPKTLKPSPREKSCCCSASSLQCRDRKIN